MKYELPHSHGLSDLILNDSALLPRVDETPSITNIQYEALAAGIANSASILAVAPTSTGKTNIAMWGLLSWISNPHKEFPKAVYLVSHRALARQKFDEFRNGLRDRYFDGDASAIVLATGDGVEDGTGVVARNPLDAPLLIATYEKYLGLISGAGIKHDMSRVMLVLDEIQLLGEDTRGRHVELLLTLLKNSRPGQIVALSAVLDKTDAERLSDWLGLKLVYTSSREKHLLYECRLPQEIMYFDTARPDPGIEIKKETKSHVTAEIVADLLRDKHNLPIVVFCMKVDRVHECVNDFLMKMGLAHETDLPLFAGLYEDTQSARQLTNLLQHRIAFHTADLLDEERRLVESKLYAKEIDVVFSTTTLGAGVNFPFTTAVFDEWIRWDFRRKQYFPIPTSEFQNMAGRAGRMGLSDGQGRIIFCSNDAFNEKRVIGAYLNPDVVTPLKAQLTPSTFEQISLSLLSSGLCETQEDLKDFLFNTFSASLERASNISELDHWQNKPQEVFEKLRVWGFIL